MPVCPQCGETAAERARFCSACGSPLPESALSSGEVRKTVTVVFSDVVDWTSLGERHDPERLRGVMERYFAVVRAILESHGGTVEKFIGDAVMAVFGTPVVHEDDALRALRAAVDVGAAVEGLNDELERDFGVRLAMRTGVNSGEVIAGNSHRREGLVTGDAVNVAQRLEQAAAPGEILIGEETHLLARNAIRVEALPALAVKGKDEPVAVFRLLEVLPATASPVRRFESPIVGRSREQMLLADAFARSVRENSCHLFTVLGPAGVGKSRLVAEVLDEIGARATVLRGACLPYGEAITFWPVREVIKQATGIEDDDDPASARAAMTDMLVDVDRAPLVAERVTEVLGLAESAGAGEETFWAVRRLLEALARERPLVVVFDDVNWGEPTFLDFVEHLADWSRDAPILLVCMGRPELLDIRPGWGGGKLNATSILLEPLTEAESGRLMSNLLGTAQLAPDVRARVSAAAEGNPLFVEEMLAMLVDDGLLQRKDGMWEATGELDAVRLPATIRILLAARLDRLGDAERRSIERAAVEGQVFHRGAVEALSDESERGSVGTSLLSLLRKEMIRADRATFAGEDAFRFRHILIRDAAYESIPKQVRAELHEQYADWLESRPGEYEELVGYHLEQAFRYRSELGPSGKREQRLARRSGELLAVAGRRAFARGDSPAAAGLLGRALELGSPEAPLRVELLIEQGTALASIGELERAEEAFQSAIDEARRLADERLEARAVLQTSFLHRYTHPERGSDELFAAAERAIAVFEAVGDHAGLSRARLLLAEIHWTQCRIGLMESDLALALQSSERTGDQKELAFVLDGLVRAALVGPMPVEEAIERCEDVLGRAPGVGTLEAAVFSVRGYLEAMRGRFEDARVYAAQSRRAYEDLAAVVSLSASEAWLGEIEMLAGDLEAAERARRAGFDALEALGERGILSTVAAYLAETLVAQGKDDEALRFTLVSEEAAAADDLSSQILWRAARAKVKARKNEAGEAERLAREAVALAGETDSPTLTADARASLGEVLLVQGRVDEGTAALREALALHEAKGNVAAAVLIGRRCEEADLRVAATRADRPS